MIIKIVMIGTIIATLFMSGIAAAYAGGPRYDYPENYDNVPGAPECWLDGFDDGANDSFDEDRDEECADEICIVVDLTPVKSHALKKIWQEVVQTKMIVRRLGMITSILIFAAILITAGPAVAVGSSDDGDDDKPEETQKYVDDPESPFYREDGHPEEPDLRPATNPDFDPDESCDLVWELKCIPGTEQGCPEGYNNFEVDVCTPIGCPEGYHDYHEDENAKCYSNDQECKYDLVLVKNEEYGDSCEPPEE